MGLCHMLALVLVFSTIDAARTRKESTSTDCSAVGCSHSCEAVVELVPPQCTCPADMTLARDDKTCTVTHFLLAMFRAIKLFKGEDDAVIAPVKARCLDYHYDRREVYAYTNKTIIRYSYGRKIALPAHIVTRPETAVTSLAVDWHNDLVYYIADQQSVVYVISREEADSREVLSHNNSDISPGWRELRVDPYSKLLFWVGDSGVFQYSEQSKTLSHDMFFGWLRPVDSISLDVTEGIIYAIGRRNNSTNKFIISTKQYSLLGK
ncbi:uncharacterized protein LOC129000045 isoform X2 [Macrosteles quadrilineatus]|uniref:uncharacterized protein LOC129000045 isoform X2 n=1 Tax=Macrosteles quadrilineatus TaxID=74068 RepID=UPI0023E2DD72|nr:uncharacterized protein LOC129000045 isoform X2 [Macrosteles quadrilineatus]